MLRDTIKDEEFYNNTCIIVTDNAISCGCCSRTVVIKGITFNTVFRVDRNFWLMCMHP